MTGSAGLLNLGPLAQLRAGRLPERIVRLLAGLWVYGLAAALMIEGGLGAAPWDVFHLGVAGRVPLSFGTVMVVTSVAVLLAWLPLRQMPGLGTVANTLLLGPFADIHLAWLPTPDGLWPRTLFMLAGVVACAVATETNCVNIRLPMASVPFHSTELAFHFPVAVIPSGFTTARTHANGWPPVWASK